jgi:CubicO group peptidase (beta-lactamase class C family)
MNRADYIAGLFTGAPQHRNFSRLRALIPFREMSASPDPLPFPAGVPLALPAAYDHDGGQHDTEAFLSDTETMALLVLKEGALRLERYAPFGGRQVPWVSMSVAKSFVSAAVGIAVGEGAIRSIEEPVTAYVPSLAGTAYDGVRIKDILQMSSGAGWNEDYSDPSSDINRFAEVSATGGAMSDFIPTHRRTCEPGTVNHYNSMDTQVLGMMLVAVTGRSIADYVEEKLWHPLGMESSGSWLTDNAGMEMAYACLNATARDFAKIGELYRNGGRWQGRQIVPADWVRASVTPDAPHLMPGVSDPMFGYGFQWWVIDGSEGEYAAIGVYNQFIYVNPTRGLTIVKLSANRTYGTTNDESSFREHETIALFRAIGKAVG